MPTVDAETVTLEGLAREVRDGFKNMSAEMGAEFEKVHKHLAEIDDDFGPRLTGLQEAVKRIEDVDGE